MLTDSTLLFTFFVTIFSSFTNIQKMILQEYTMLVNIYIIELFILHCLINTLNLDSVISGSIHFLRQIIRFLYTVTELQAAFFLYLNMWYIREYFYMLLLLSSFLVFCHSVVSLFSTYEFELLWLSFVSPFLKYVLPNCQKYNCFI